MAGLHAAHGEAVQADPNKPTLKAPGTRRLKLEFDELLSSFGFKFNLRRYIMIAASMHHAGVAKVLLKAE
jgi:hypothetical protein